MEWKEFTTTILMVKTLTLNSMNLPIYRLCLFRISDLNLNGICNLSNLQHVERTAKYSAFGSLLSILKLGESLRFMRWALLNRAHMRKRKEWCGSMWWCDYWTCKIQKWADLCTETNYSRMRNNKSSWCNLLYHRFYEFIKDEK